jgi:outer membrane receptor for ferric coprogen and ferric-rhodotorulic acid
VPRHQFAAWTRYDLTDRLGVGLGVTHQSESFASISNAVELPAFTRVDLGVFVKLTDRIEAQVNVENLSTRIIFRQRTTTITSRRRTAECRVHGAGGLLAALYPAVPDSCCS